MTPRQEIYDTYWKFATERQNIFFKKLNGDSPQYTKDPILQEYKFCNAYRASDRVSQFLIKNVIYSKKFCEEDLLLRIVLFRLLNKIETWEKLEQEMGEVTLQTFNVQRYDETLTKIKKVQPIYGNAFILCATKSFGYDKKHQNHLALLTHVFKTQYKNKILNSKTLKNLFENLRELPLLGNFMAYQLAIDLNYSELFDFDEDDFTMAGPGAERGIKKCFSSLNGKSREYVIKYMVDNQEKEFKRLGLNFKSLWGRPLKAIDCQGLFCETDKYCRQKFPNLKSNRKKIKAKYKPNTKPISYFYPPKWEINQKIAH